MVGSPFLRRKICGNCFRTIVLRHLTGWPGYPGGRAFRGPGREYIWTIIAIFVGTLKEESKVMEKVWIVESRYYNFDQDDGQDIYIRNDTYVHKSEEGARGRFEALKEDLELWGVGEDDCETYVITDNRIVLEYSYQANELILYENKVYD